MNLVLLITMIGVLALLILLQKELNKKSEGNSKIILYLSMTLVGFAIGVLGFIVFG